MGKIIGIDLGTTNSCVAVMEGTNRLSSPTVKEGEQLPPSLLLLKMENEKLAIRPNVRQSPILITPFFP